MFPYFKVSNFNRLKGLSSLGLLALAVKSTKCEDDDKILSLKKKVGYKAIDDYVLSGMTIGLGTGSTCYFSLERLDQKLKSHSLKDITVVPCSEFTKNQCISRNIPITTLSNISKNIKEGKPVDISIDGVDEIDPSLSMTKGGSGCLFREKLIERASNKVIIVCDDSKLTSQLGTGHPLAVEVTPFSHEFIRTALENLPSFYGNARAILRRGQISNNSSDGTNISVTDNGNYIIDIYFSEPIADVNRASAELDSLTGIVEHGLIIDMDPIVLIASEDMIRVAKKKKEIGIEGESPWWSKKSTKVPMDRISLDNRQPDNFSTDP